MQLNTKIALSLATSALLIMSGCSSDSSGDNNVNNGGTSNNPPAVQTSSVTGKAVDGYLVNATVCLDLSLDGYCQIGDEPATYTNSDGSFELSVSPAQKSAYPDYKKAPLLVYSGYDIDTGVDFTGKLRSTLGSGDSINVSPLSTAVQALVSDSVSVEQAEASVRNMLDLPAGADLKADPVEAAKTDPALLKAALKLQKTLEVLAAAKVEAGSTEQNKNKIVEELYKEIAKKAVENKKLTTAVVAVVAADSKLNDKAQESATAISGQIDLIVGTDGISDTAVIGTKIGAVKEEIVVKAIQDGGSVPTNEELKIVTDTSFSLLHAKELLRLVQMEDVETAGRKLSEDVKTVLVAAGMGETAFLPAETEISALKANEKTFLVGAALDDLRNAAFDALKLKLEAEAKAAAEQAALEKQVQELEAALAAAKDDAAEKARLEAEKEAKEAEMQAALVAAKAEADAAAAKAEADRLARLEEEAQKALDADLLTQAELDKIKADKETALAVELASQHKIDAAALINSVKVLGNNASDVANVNDAKLMFSQVRETVATAVDLESEELNSSTIVGSQIDTLQTKIQPVVEDIASDFNASASSLQTSIEGFSSSLETNFKPTMQTIGDRIDALASQTENFAYDVNWSVSAGSDTLARTISMDDESGDDTEVFTLNGQVLTVVTEEVGIDDRRPKSLIGSLNITGTDYNLSINSFSLLNGKANFVASGEIVGANDSKMTLKTLEVSTDLNLNVDNFNAIQNAQVSFDGVLRSDGRSLEGNLSLNEGATSVLEGKYTGQSGEPSFSGKITAKLSSNEVLNTLAGRSEAWISKYQPILMVKRADGTKNLVISSVESYDQSGEHFTFTTNGGSDAECTITKNDTPTGFDNNVSCSNGDTLMPMSSDGMKVIATVDGKDMLVRDTWLNYYDDGMGQGHMERVINFENDQTYVDNGILKLNGQAITISNIRVEENKNVLDMNFDTRFDGVVTDGSKKIAATIGIINALETKIYAQNVEITDGTSSFTVAELSLSVPRSKFVDLTNGGTYQDSYHSNRCDMYDCYSYEVTHSDFENYTVVYDRYRDYSADNEGDFNPLKEISSAKLDQLKLKIVDADNAALLIDANASFVNDNTMKAYFDGSYSYLSTKFTGHIDIDGTLGDETVIGKASVKGSVEANGFMPFDITATVEAIDNETVNAYALFSRGATYQLSLELNHSENATTRTNVFKLRDSNGVLGNMSVSENIETGTETGNVLNITNSSGTSLATYGEDATGNAWEIKYNDSSTETLF